VAEDLRGEGRAHGEAHDHANQSPTRVAVEERGQQQQWQRKEVEATIQCGGCMGLGLGVGAPSWKA